MLARLELMIMQTKCRVPFDFLQSYKSKGKSKGKVFKLTSLSLNINIIMLKPFEFNKRLT